MRSVLLGAAIGVLAVSCHARSVEKSCKGASKSANAGKALYFITNDDKNAVVAVPIGADGKLSGGSSTATGGAGSLSIDGSTNEPAASDGLISQSSLSLAGNSLFTVNAGSNTVTMFAIDKADPTKLTMVGKPVSVPGEFPNTIAASSKNKMVCVGMTGAVAGISCAQFDAKNGIGKMDGLREFDIGQTTPPVGPTNTLSQVFWSNDEKTLLSTTKGDPPTNKTGFFSAFAVGGSGNGNGGNRCSGKSKNKDVSLSSQEARSVVNGTAVLFGSLPIPKTSNVFATDASFGGTILSLDNKGNQASLSASQPIDSQKATCWVTISPATNSAFVTDVATPRLVEMSLDDASILGQIDVASTGAKGVIDLKAAGNLIYALAPGSNNTNTQVLVMDVKGGSKGAKMIQAFDVASLGVGSSAQGMVVLE